MKYENNSKAPFSAYITNLGKYTEGELTGKWIDFPITAEQLSEVNKDIGIGELRADGSVYEEIFITDYDCNIPGLESSLGEYSNINELNHLATVIDSMDDVYSDTLYAAFETESYNAISEGVKGAINLAENVKNGTFSLIEDVKNEEDMGRYLIRESSEKVPEWLENYIDYESYGRDTAVDGYYTSNGYIREETEYKDYYNGLEDIAKEELVTGYDKNVAEEIVLDEPETAPKM